MKTSVECIPCFVSQAEKLVLKQITEPADREVLLRRVLEYLASVSFSLTPPQIAREIHHLIFEVSGNNDPFRDDRLMQNKVALELLPQLRSHVSGSANPWTEAVKLCIAGNAIDLGVYHELDRQEIESAMFETLSQPFDSISADRLKQRIQNSGSILFIGDNAGEIVFDMLLIEMILELHRSDDIRSLTYVVRGSPTLNDALLEDARQVGLDLLVEVIDSGSDVPGIVLEECNQQLRERFQKAELVIAKGQGNYETLNHLDGDISFLFKAKCPVIAADAGVEKGDLALIEYPIQTRQL